MSYNENYVTSSDSTDDLGVKFICVCCNIPYYYEEPDLCTSTTGSWCRGCVIMAVLKYMAEEVV